MPRAARMVVDGGIYHVLTRGNNEQAIFHEAMDYERYLQLLMTHAARHHVGIHHFMLMPNHVHLVLRVAAADGLKKLMQRVNLTYALYYQRRYCYRGHVWQGRFKSFPLNREHDVLECGRYIELHPVRDGLAQDPGGYAWSSYRIYTGSQENPLIAANPFYKTFGRSVHERQARYRQFIHSGIGADPLPSLRALEERFGAYRPSARVGRPRKAHTIAEHARNIARLAAVIWTLTTQLVFAQSTNGSYALMQETVSSAGGVIGGGNPMRAQTMLGLPAAGAASNGSYTLIVGVTPDTAAAQPPVTMPMTVSGTIDDNTAAVTVNGIPGTVSAGIFTAQNVMLVLGRNTLTAVATDAIGNATSRSIMVDLDLSEAEKTPRFSCTIRGTINDSTSTVTVNGIQAGITNGEFSASVPLTSGFNTLTAAAIDPAGNTSTQSIRVFVPQPTQPPAKPTVGTVGDPIPEVTTASSITIGGTKTAGTSIWINGTQVVAQSDATTWTATVGLVEGDNVLQITAKDEAGVSSAQTITTIIVDNQAPAVTFQPPAKTNLSPALLSGTVDDSRTTITINGIVAQRDGLNFQAPIPLTMGANMLHVVAVSPRNLRTEFDRTVTRGSVPTLQSMQPANRSKLYIATAAGIQMSASDQNGDSMEYRVLLDSQPVTSWSANSTQSWTPGTAHGGAHKLQAEVRDGYGGSNILEIDVLILRQPVLPP